MRFFLCQSRMLIENLTGTCGFKAMADLYHKQMRHMMSRPIGAYLGRLGELGPLVSTPWVKRNAPRAPRLVSGAPGTAESSARINYTSQ